MSFLPSFGLDLKLRFVRFVLRASLRNFTSCEPPPGEVCCGGGSLLLLFAAAMSLSSSSASSSLPRAGGGFGGKASSLARVVTSCDDVLAGADCSMLHSELS